MGKQWSESSQDKVKDCYDALSTLKFTGCAKELKIQWHLQRKTRFHLGLKEKRVFCDNIESEGEFLKKKKERKGKVITDVTECLC